MNKSMYAVLRQLLLCVVLTAVLFAPTFQSRAEAAPNSGWNGAAYMGLKAPFKGGTTYTVTSTHGGSPRHAIDFAVKNQPVLAMYSGTVLRYVPNNGSAGNSLYIDHGDGYCSAYLHLESSVVRAGERVKQGDQIARSGNTGNGQYHLHVEVDRIVNGSCNTDRPFTPEVPMYFDEVPGRELRTGDRVTSQNYPSPPNGYVFCSFENQRCNFNGTKDVAYGAKGRFSYQNGVTGGIDCNNNTFGDPVPGELKACYIKSNGGIYYHLVAKHSGKCLDASGASTDDGAPIIQFACRSTDNANQSWKLVPVQSNGSVYYELVAKHSGKCLDVEGASTQAAAPLIQYRCQGNDNQLFKIEPVGSSYRLVAKHSGQCVDVEGGKTDNGIRLIQYPCYNSNNQLWFIQP